MPNVNSSIVRNLCDEAEFSTLQQKLAAAVIQNSKQLSDSCCNTDRNFCRGHYTPSVHAEARALLNFYGNKIYFNKFRGWCFYDESYQARKINIMVVRVTRNGCLANARPCRKCVRMMKDLRVKKVFYSSGKDSEIVCENVRDIFSIQDSSSGRHFSRIEFNLPKNDIEYYKYILERDSPKELKKVNLDYFIRFNLTYLLPNCNIKISNRKGKTYVQIKDEERVITTIIVL